MGEPSGYVMIKANCDKCGPFQVQRRRKYRTTSDGRVFDLPQQVVCPTCRMWAKITKVEEVA